MPHTNPVSQKPHPLRIVTRAMCCAIGHHADAAIAAIRARINHFRETEFVARDGQPIMGAHLYEVDAWGEDRIDLMLHSVIAQCLSKTPQVPTEQIGLMVMTTSVNHHGLPSQRLAEELQRFTEGQVAGFEPFFPESILCSYGKGGIARALGEADQWMNQPNGPQQVLLIGIDSLLHAAAIEHYLLQERLVTGYNADGFIPAEGAAALLLTSKQADTPALWIDAWASDEETWRIDGGQPLRAEALSRAVRKVIGLAGTELAALKFHASGMNGESWYAKEVSLTLSRVIERRVADFPHHMIAQFTGETGAAAPALTLAWLASAMGRTTSPTGNSALVHFSDEMGPRSALIVRYRASDTRVTQAPAGG
jgi:3-oxoacyl-[acyl-carrier-protein] synthase I